MADATQLLDGDLDLSFDTSNEETEAKQKLVVAYLDLITSEDGDISESFPLHLGRNLIGRLPKEETAVTSEEEEDGQVHKVLIDRSSISLEHAEIIIQEWFPLDEDAPATLPNYCHQITSTGEDGTTINLIIDLRATQVLDLKSTNKTHLSNKIETLGIRCAPRIPKTLEHGQYLSFGDVKMRFRVVGKNREEDKKLAPDTDSTQAYGMPEDATLPYATDEPEKTLAYQGEDDLYGSAGGSVERDDSVPPPVTAAKSTRAAAPAAASTADATQAYGADEPPAPSPPRSAGAAVAIPASPDAIPHSEDEDADMDGAPTQIYAAAGEAGVEPTLVIPTSPVEALSPPHRATSKLSVAPKSTPSTSTPNSLPKPSPKPPSLNDEKYEEKYDEKDENVIVPSIPNSKKSNSATSARPISPDPSSPMDLDEDEEADAGPGASHCTPPPESIPGVPLTIPPTTTPDVHPSVPPTPSTSNVKRSLSRPDSLATASLPSESGATLSYQPATHAPPSMAAAAAATASLPPSAKPQNTPPASASRTRSQLSATPPIVPPSDETPSLQLTLEFDTPEPPPEPATISLKPTPPAAALPPPIKSDKDADGDVDMADVDDDEKKADEKREDHPLPPSRSLSNMSGASGATAASGTIPSWNRKKRVEDGNAAPSASPPSNAIITHEIVPTATAAAATTAKSSKPLSALELKQQKFHQKAAEKARKDAERAKAREEAASTEPKSTASKAAAAAVVEPVAPEVSVSKPEDETPEPISLPLPAKRSSRGSNAAAAKKEAAAAQQKKAEEEAEAAAIAAVEEAKRQEEEEAAERERKQTADEAAAAVAAELAAKTEAEQAAKLEANKLSAPIAPSASTTASRSKSSAASRRRVGRSTQIDEEASPISSSDTATRGPTPVAASAAAASSSSTSALIVPPVVADDAPTEIQHTEDQAEQPAAATTAKRGRRGKAAAAAVEPTKAEIKEDEPQPIDVDESAKSEEPIKRGRSRAAKSAVAPVAEKLSEPAPLAVEPTKTPSATTSKATRKRGAAAMELEHEEKASESKVEETSAMPKNKKSKVEEPPTVESKPEPTPEVVVVTPAATPSRSRRSSGTPPSVEPTVSATKPSADLLPAAAATKSTGRSKRKQVDEPSPVEVKETEPEPIAIEQPTAKRARGAKAAAVSTTKEEEKVEAPAARSVTPTKQGRGRATTKSSVSATDMMDVEEEKSSDASSSTSSAAAAAASSSTAFAAVVHHPKVVITGIDMSSLLGGSDVSSALTKLKGQLIDDVLACTHLITDKVRRTEKFLTAYSIVPHLLHYDWLKDSITAGAFQDESRYRLKDTESEQKFDFKLSARDPTKRFLDGFDIFVAPNVKPPPTAMHGIIQGAGGKLLAKPPTSFSSNTLIVSSVNDEKVHTKLVKLGFTIHTNELILTGVLRQRLQVDEPNHILVGGSKSSEASKPAKAKRK